MTVLWLFRPQLSWPEADNAFFFLWVSLHVTLKRGRSYTVDVLILERRAKSLQYYRWQENKLPFSGIFCLLLIPRSRFSSIMWLSTVAACFLSGLMLRLRWLISTVLPSFRLCGFFCWFLKRQHVVCLTALTAPYVVISDVGRGREAVWCSGLVQPWLTGCLPCLCLVAAAWEQNSSTRKEEPRAVLGHWALIHDS